MKNIRYGEIERFDAVSSIWICVVPMFYFHHSTWCHWMEQRGSRDDMSNCTGKVQTLALYKPSVSGYAITLDMTRLKDLHPYI